MNDLNIAELNAVLLDRNRPVQELPTRLNAAPELPNLTKAKLTEIMFDQVGLNKREAMDMVEAFFDEISNALERGEEVKLSGFGNFRLRDKPQRPGRNPKTGAIIPIPARRVATFHPSQKLKADCQGQK